MDLLTHCATSQFWNALIGHSTHRNLSTQCLAVTRVKGAAGLRPPTTFVHGKLCSGAVGRWAVFVVLSFLF